MNMHWSVGLFWALALLFAAVAAVLVMRPLLRRRAPSDVAERRQINIAVYRDQMHELEADRRNGLLSDEQYASAKGELEVRLAEDALTEEAVGAVGVGGRRRWLAYGLGATLPVVAFGLYFLLGNPLAIQVAAEGAEGPASIEAMVQAAEQKLKANPKDAQGWFTLARTYGALDRWPEAKQAYLKAAELVPNEAAVWSGLAEAAAMLQGRKLDGEPMQLVAKALQLDPNDPKAHELSGIQAFQSQDYAQAVHHWRALLAMAPPDPEYAAELRRAIQEARHLAEQAGKPIDLGPSIGGSIELAAKLKGKIRPEAVLFVFARPVGGQGMPLAAFRVSAGDLPIRFEIDDSHALGDAKLSDHKQVQLVARIANSGQPNAGKGDLEGRLESVKVGSRNIKLVIDREMP
ncbi:MAG: c-type cytochrome biogenesis protein CcmI [Hydrogenophilaceae bacterium]|nr:c-type cytochrome biogenesis protein CcmI [Hydrogenophilaceae bacterium]